MKKDHLRNLILSAFFLSLGATLPFLFGQVQSIGEVLLPMHIPIFLCGIICGWKYGFCVGAILPFFRTFLFGMPPLYPTAIAIAFEMATYGLVIGLLCARRNRLSTGYLLFSLLSSMMIGRIVWGIAQATLLGLADKPFGFRAFIVGGVLNEIPGIVIQLILIPIIIKILQRPKQVDPRHE